MNNLCVIPARGGSKRIPRKNIKNFLGKPILAYSIDVALKSKLFEEIIVSTEDEEIAEIAKTFGARVPFLRSIENSDDYSTTVDVVKEVLNSYRNLGKSFENVCILYPTAPLVTSLRLKEGYNHLRDYNSVLPITKFSFPVWRAFKLKSELLTYQWPEFEKKRSQDLETLYHDAGQWYWIRTSCIRDTLIPDKTTAILLNPMEVQDIDTFEDWELAELKFLKRNSSRKTNGL